MVINVFRYREEWPRNRCLLYLATARGSPLLLCRWRVRVLYIRRTEIFFFFFFPALHPISFSTTRARPKFYSYLNYRIITAHTYKYRDTSCANDLARVECLGNGKMSKPRFQYPLRCPSFSVFLRHDTRARARSHTYTLYTYISPYPGQTSSPSDLHAHAAAPISFRANEKNPQRWPVNVSGALSSVRLKRLSEISAIRKISLREIFFVCIPFEKRKI